MKKPIVIYDLDARSNVWVGKVMDNGVEVKRFYSLSYDGAVQKGEKEIERWQASTKVRNGGTKTGLHF